MKVKEPLRFEFIKNEEDFGEEFMEFGSYYYRSLSLRFLFEDGTKKIKKNSKWKFIVEEVITDESLSPN